MPFTFIFHLIGINLPAKLIQAGYFKLILWHVNVHACAFGQQFVRLGIINARPCFGNLSLAFASLADDLQHSSNRHILAILYFEFSSEHKTRVGRVAAHVCPSADLVDDSRYNTAMQNTGVALEMIGRNVLRFNDARFGFINMQMQANRIFQSTNKAVT